MLFRIFLFFLGVVFLVLEASFRTSTPSDSVHSEQFLRKSTEVFKISFFLAYITYNFMMVEVNHPYS